MKFMLVHFTWALVMLSPALHAQETQGPPPVFVVTEQAVKKYVSPTVMYSATVISRNDAHLAGEISGHLTWVAEVGDRFRKGERVAKLDDVFIRQQVIEEQSIIQSEQAARLTRHARISPSRATTSCRPRRVSRRPRNA